MKYLLHTYGCQMNVRDAEAVAAILEAAGHLPAINEDDADLVLVNTCSVRGKAEDKAVGKLGLLCATKRTAPHRLVGVMGCMAQRRGAALRQKIPLLDFVVGTRQQQAIPAILDRLAAGERGIVQLDDPGVAPRVPDAHLSGGISAFVTILLGCNRRCAYCVVPDVRGAEYSRPAAEVLEEVRGLAARGVREVTLLGQSVMSYGRSNPVWERGAPSPGGFREDLPRLLEAVSAIPGLCRIRFTSGHPSGCTPELVRAMREISLVCPHLHLPVQSGADRILGLMRRGYTAAEYLEAVARLREGRPDFALTSDVIVGFPTETAEEFDASRRLMEAAAFDNTYIFKYSPRPNTPAAAMPDDVLAGEKVRRNQVLLDEQDVRGQRLNEAYVGRTVEVLAEGVSLRNAQRWSGRTPTNKIVVFPHLPFIAAGDLVSVRITSAKPQALYGEIVRP
ncbi:MAG: tRNA (N6-isopentenyl adenosine(37)-C2)-methylthiotransferase MiaB [Kiritimatiellia bacterium]